MSFLLLGAIGSQATSGLVNSFDLLETSILGSAASSFTFSSLDSYSQYKHLQVRLTTETTSTGTGTRDLLLRFNGDSNLNYAWHEIRGTGSAFARTASSNVNSITLQNGTAESNNVAGNPAVIIDILDFSNSSKKTTTRAILGQYGSNSLYRMCLTSGLWNNTNAVTSMTFLNDASQDWAIGSRFSLYGIKG